MLSFNTKSTILEQKCANFCFFCANKKQQVAQPSGYEKIYCSFVCCFCGHCGFMCGVHQKC